MWLYVNQHCGALCKKLTEHGTEGAGAVELGADLAAAAQASDRQDSALRTISGTVPWPQKVA